jgi:pyruvate dehydrogenase E2 component (dihydrolipoamide acetyltransferase)
VEEPEPGAEADEPRPNAEVRVQATPPVRKLARELGVDLAKIEGSGPGGRVTRADVEAFAATARTEHPPEVTPALEPAPSAAERPAPAAPSQPEPAVAAEARPAHVPAQQPPRLRARPAHPEIAPGHRAPLRGIRRTIAERLLEAHRRIPAVTHVEECDVTELDATRRLANERHPAGPRLTYMPFIVKAVVAALKDNPQLNASLDEDAGEIVYHDRYDINIAVETPQGLTVPLLRDADRKRLRQLASEIERLAQGAREHTLAPEDHRPGTFTISSPGRYGGLMATPIIFPPQAAILGVHRAVDRPVVRDGQVMIRKMMNLSVTFDHRILDGVTAARFLLEIVELLEHPAVLALES